MSEDPDLLAFLNELENDITADVQPHAGEEADFREIAFTRLFSEELDAAGFLESPRVCHYENGKGASAVKVSAYGVPDEDSRLDLIVTAYVAGPHVEIPTLNATEVESYLNKVVRFLGKALGELHEQTDPGLPEHFMAARIHELKGQFDRVNFVLLTNAKLAIRREKKRKTEVHGAMASFEIWDVERFRRLRESGAGYEALNVNLRDQRDGGLPCVRLDGNEEGYRTCVAIFPGVLLRDLYDEHGSRLLELNVRSYLQAKGKINNHILQTLRNDPADFMAYNNGITVVAEKIVFGRMQNGSEGILELEGMQIVNGGQTTASIHRAAKEYGADLAKVHVQGKIVTVDPERFNEVVPLISRYANSQNKVTEPDLAANHRFHVGFERVAKREWTPDQASKWFYERARGSYQTARTRDGTTEAKRRDFDRKYPTSQRFSKEDLARFENCWRALPSVVNRGSQKNFTHFMTLVKQELGDLPETWEPAPEGFKRTIAKAILFRDVQHIVKSLKEITAYRINVTTYTVALLAEKTARRIDLEDIWRNQKISPPLSEMATQWALVVFKSLMEYAQSQTAHIDNTLKAPATWEFLRSLDLRVTSLVERGLVATNSLSEGYSGARSVSPVVQERSSDDHNNAARCMELGPKQWLSLVDWCQTQGTFEKWQLGIATTLASYAAQGWARVPSVKQAKHGATLIEAGRAAGIFNAS